MTDLECAQRQNRLYRRSNESLAKFALLAVNTRGHSLDKLTMGRESRQLLLSSFRASSGGMVTSRRIAPLISDLRVPVRAHLSGKVGMWFDSQSTFLTTGTARGPAMLNAFDNALRVAKIVDFNLIKVSTSLPRADRCAASPGRCRSWTKEA
jgi:hypothetical protein